jgi:hypothetical protein
LLTTFDEILRLFATVFAVALDKPLALFIPKAFNCLALYSPMPFTCVSDSIAPAEDTVFAAFFIATVLVRPAGFSYFAVSTATV